MATGLGKSRCIVELVRFLMLLDPRPCFLVAHRKELLDSLRSTMLAVAGIPSSDHPSKPSISNITVCSVQTLHNYIKKNPDFTLGHLIIDECHRSMALTYQRSILEATGKVIGVTATPLRVDKKPLGDVYQCLIPCELQVYEAIQKGYLCPYYLRVQEQFSVLNRNETASIKEGNEKALLKVKPMVEDIRTYYRERKTIVFCGSVEVANKMQETLDDGHVVTSEGGQKHRKKVIEYLENGGNGTIVFNVGLYVEGLDVPDISCTVNTVATTSLTKLWQLMGRGLRPDKSKLNCLCVDYTNTPTRLPLPGDFVEWTLDGVIKVKRNEKIEGRIKNEDFEELDYIVDLAPMVLESTVQSVIINTKLLPYFNKIVPHILVYYLYLNPKANKRLILDNLQYTWNYATNASRWLEQNFSRLIIDSNALLKIRKINPHRYRDRLIKDVQDCRDASYPEIICGTSLNYDDLLRGIQCN